MRNTHNHCRWMHGLKLALLLRGVGGHEDAHHSPGSLSVPGPPERATLDAIMNSTSSDATSVPGPPECAMLEVIGATTLRAVFEPPLLDGGSIDASSFEMQHSLENLGSVDSVYGSRSTADEQSLSYMHVPSTEPSITTVVKLESTEHSTRVVELETTEPVVTDVKLAVSNTNSSTTSKSTEPVVTDVCCLS